MSDLRPDKGHPSSHLLSIDVPLVLIDLRHFVIVEASAGAQRLTGHPSLDIIGHPIQEFFGPDQPSPLRPLRALREGSVDFFRAENRLEMQGELLGTFIAWVRRVELDGRSLALAAIARANGPDQLVESFAASRSAMAIVIAKPDWQITAVSREASQVLGVPPQSLLQNSVLEFVAGESRHRMAAADRQARHGDCVSFEIELVRGSRKGIALRCALATLAGGAGRCLVFMDIPEEGDLRLRVQDLEYHLWRIAAEVEASRIAEGVRLMSHLAGVPEMEALTVRQWDVLRRLVQGQRVPTIARELYLSQSTVRNHLTRIFQRFQVHSQPELLDRLREKGLNA